MGKGKSQVHELLQDATVPSSATSIVSLGSAPPSADKEGGFLFALTHHLIGDDEESHEAEEWRELQILTDNNACPGGFNWLSLDPSANPRLEVAPGRDQDPDHVPGV